MKIVIILNLMTSKDMDDVSIGKNNDFGAVGKCSKVVYTVSCWHKKNSVRLWTAFAETVNKIRCSKLKLNWYFVSRNYDAPQVLQFEKESYLGVKSLS